MFVPTFTTTTSTTPLVPTQRRRLAPQKLSPETKSSSANVSMHDPSHDMRPGGDEVPAVIELPRNAESVPTENVHVHPMTITVAFPLAVFLPSVVAAALQLPSDVLEVGVRSSSASGRWVRQDCIRGAVIELLAALKAPQRLPPLKADSMMTGTATFPQAASKTFVLLAFVFGLERGQWSRFDAFTVTVRPSWEPSENGKRSRDGPQEEVVLNSGGYIDVSDATMAAAGDDWVEWLWRIHNDTGIHTTSAGSRVIVYFSLMHQERSPLPTPQTLNSGKSIYPPSVALVGPQFCPKASAMFEASRGSNRQQKERVHSQVPMTPPRRGAHDPYGLPAYVNSASGTLHIDSKCADSKSTRSDVFTAVAEATKSSSAVDRTTNKTAKPVSQASVPNSLAPETCLTDEDDATWFSPHKALWAAADAAHFAQVVATLPLRKVQRLQRPAHVGAEIARRTVCVIGLMSGSPSHDKDGDTGNTVIPTTSQELLGFAQYYVHERSHSGAIPNDRSPRDVVSIESRGADGRYTFIEFGSVAAAESFRTAVAAAVHVDAPLPFGGDTDGAEIGSLAWCQQWGRRLHHLGSNVAIEAAVTTINRSIWAFWPLLGVSIGGLIRSVLRRDGLSLHHVQTAVEASDQQLLANQFQGDGGVPIAKSGVITEVPLSQPSPSTSLPAEVEAAVLRVLQPVQSEQTQLQTVLLSLAGSEGHAEVRDVLIHVSTPISECEPTFNTAPGTAVRRLQGHLQGVVEAALKEFRDETSQHHQFSIAPTLTEVSGNGAGTLPLPLRTAFHSTSEDLVALSTAVFVAAADTEQRLNCAAEQAKGSTDVHATFLSAVLPELRSTVQAERGVLLCCCLSQLLLQLPCAWQRHSLPLRLWHRKIARHLAWRIKSTAEELAPKLSAAAPALILKKSISDPYILTLLVSHVRRLQEAVLKALHQTQSALEALQEHSEDGASECDHVEGLVQDLTVARTVLVAALP